MQLLLRVVRHIVEGIFWLSIFASPFLIGAIMALVLYLNDYRTLAVIAFCIGIISGVILAEKIRKKYGCSTYVGSLLSTPDIWPNEVDEIDKKELGKNK